MKNDIYSKTRKLASLLKNESISNSELAKELTDAIDYSATSSEALMKLKYHIRKTLLDKGKYSTELINLSSDIYSDIVKLIG
ncbi:hypothetical protein FCL49_11020 [Serratia proteamaculans]|nr:hypothetical protein [Serratia proteamaculans]NTZ28632.1 hypothetical protein [Serratia proteamaculans]